MRIQADSQRCLFQEEGNRNLNGNAIKRAFNYSGHL